MKRTGYRLLGIGWIPLYAFLFWLLFEKLELLDDGNQIHVFGLMAISVIAYGTLIYIIGRHVRGDNRNKRLPDEPATFVVPRQYPGYQNLGRKNYIKDPTQKDDEGKSSNHL